MMSIPSPRRPEGLLALPVPVVDVVGGLPVRRRAALLATREEVLRDPAGGTGAGTGLALRQYGPGCLALALGGTFATGDVARLRGLDAVLRRLATAELVVELSALRLWDAVLARALARVRVRALVAGATIELHSAPEGLGVALGGTSGREGWT